MPVSGVTERPLEQLNAVGRRGLPGVVDHDPVGIETEVDEVAVELQDVLAGAVGRGQIAVSRGRAVHQDHGLAVDLEQRPARVDHLPDVRQPRDRSAEAVVDGLGSVVAERP